MCRVFFSLLVGHSALAGAIKCRHRLAGPQTFPQWRRLADTLANSPAPAVRTDLPVLVIGAGPAGLPALKELQSVGIASEAVDSGPGPGGLWDPNNPQSPAYEGMKTNSSMATTHLGDPFPVGHPDYFSKERALEYLQGFSARHRLGPITRYNTSVQKAERNADGSWTVTLLSNGRSSAHQYRALVLASGRESKNSRRYPHALWEQAKANAVEVFHSSDYRNSHSCQGKRVLIVGLGNSGGEIATEISKVAARTLLCVRTAPWIVPEYIGGTPADKFAQSSPRWTPKWIEDLVFNTVVRWYVGHPHTIGLRNLDHALLEKLPVTDRGISQAIRTHRVLVRSNLAEFTSGKAVFEDGAEKAEPVDAVVFATGYNLEYSYLPSGTFQHGDELPFWIFHPNDPNLLFVYSVGVAQGIWSIFAEQAKTIAGYLKAQERGTSHYLKLLSMRDLPNPPMRRHVFRLAPVEYLDARTYTDWLQKLDFWLRE